MVGAPRENKKDEHGFRYLETCLLEYREGTERRRALTIQREAPTRVLFDGGFHYYRLSCLLGE